MFHGNRGGVTMNMLKYQVFLSHNISKMTLSQHHFYDVEDYKMLLLQSILRIFILGLNLNLLYQLFRKVGIEEKKTSMTQKYNLKNPNRK
jgi:hypothetical protein